MSRLELEMVVMRAPPARAPVDAGRSLLHASSPLPHTARGEGCPVKPKQWTPLEEQCRYKYILHLPGISDWLEHFKHQLACGSVNIFIGACQTQTSRKQVLLVESATSGHAARMGGKGHGRGRLKGAAFDLTDAPDRGGAAAGSRPQRQTRVREPGLLGPPRTFDHFDFSGPLLKQGQHFLFVPVGGAGGGGGGVCKQLIAAMSQLEAVPERAKCIARGGQELSRAMDMEHVYDYMASTLSEASVRQQEGVARQVIRAENSRLVTKQNFFSFVPPAKRPWMENIFVPAHQSRFNNTPLLPPHGDETSSGLFH